MCPETQCLKVDETLDFDVAAMAEPLACAIHGMDKVKLQTGQVVLVVGGGTIGLLMVQRQACRSMQSLIRSLQLLVHVSIRILSSEQ